MRKHLLCVLRGMLFIGVSVQIVFGIIWCVANLGQLQHFGDTRIYVDISNNFICDDYTGILYPMLIRVFRGIGDFFKVPWYVFLYILQLSGAFAAVFLLVRFVKIPVFWKLWLCMGVVTIPAAMQCHLAVLPNSLACSLYLVMIALGLRLLKGAENGHLHIVAGMGGLWLAASMLMPEYGLFGGVLLLLFCIRKIVSVKKEGNFKANLYTLLLVAAFGGMVVSMQTLTQKPEELGIPENSVALRMVSRFVWPNLQDYHSAWPNEVRAVISWSDAGIVSQRADGIQTVFAPMMEQALGEKEAEKVYWKLVGTAAHIRTRDIVESIVWDGACHIFSPYLLTKQLEGVGYQSYSGRNYEIMKAHAPGITKHYIAYEGWWFVTGIVVAALISIITINDKRKSLLAGKGLLIVSALVMVIYYTMQGAGIMDYKQTIYVTVLWTLWMCSHAMPDKAEM